MAEKKGRSKESSDFSTVQMVVLSGSSAIRKSPTLLSAGLVVMVVGDAWWSTLRETAAGKDGTQDLRFRDERKVSPGLGRRREGSLRSLLCGGSVACRPGL